MFLNKQRNGGKLQSRPALEWNPGCYNDELYTELWKACAGPLVEVPVAGERVFYFPQGHMEQQGIESEEIPDFKLPPKILCRVLSVMLSKDLLRSLPNFLHPRNKFLMNADHLSFTSEKQVHDELLMTPKDQSPIIPSFYDFESLNIKRLAIPKIVPPSVALASHIIPEDIGLLHSLKKLDLSGNDFIHLPTSMKNLSKLKHARLSNCVKLETLPGLTELQTLNLSNCSSVKSLLEPSHTTARNFNCTKLQSFSHQLSQFSELTYLNLSSNDFEAIPESITDLSSLGTLCLNNCKNLKSVENLPQSLEYLYAHGCDSMENVILSPNHSIKHLDLNHCFNLQQENEQLITQFLNNEEVSSVQRSICLPGARIPSYFENRSWAFSYDWSCEEDDEMIQINLRPNLYRASEIEETETEER
ncbi:unnamed protein product [Eruca vesicaria subsp. sativa]|uniref:Uncharacterized protein n=1 Tax=Eruca vesicaria subsp. sativa TaxID=29727 RepID=A0ABC8K147_ERUVS|nr:unnamed protein product [Eruca vesicaria subsp. sativa]